MPHLTILNFVLLVIIVPIHVFHATCRVGTLITIFAGAFCRAELFREESKFRTDTEVRHREQNNFLKHRISRQLMAIINVQV